MIFVDTNVFMYAVGGEHPLRDRAQRFFMEAIESSVPCVTSAEVLQELLHAYVPVGRFATLDAAFALVDDVISTTGLGARDLIHLACCRRRNATAIQTFDRGLAAAFARR